MKKQKKQNDKWNRTNNKQFKLFDSNQKFLFRQNNAMLIIGSLSKSNKSNLIQKQTQHPSIQWKDDMGKRALDKKLKQKLQTEPNPQIKMQKQQNKKDYNLKFFDNTLTFKNRKKIISQFINSAKNQNQNKQQINIKQSMRWSGHQFYRQIKTAIKNQNHKEAKTLDRFYKYQDKKIRKAYDRLITIDLNQQSKIQEKKGEINRIQKNSSYEIKTARKNTTPYWDQYQLALKIKKPSQINKKQEEKKKRIENIINSSQILNKKIKSQLLFFFQSKRNNSMNQVQRDKNIMKMRNIRNIKSIKNQIKYSSSHKTIFSKNWQ